MKFKLIASIIIGGIVFTKNPNLTEEIIDVDEDLVQKNDLIKRGYLEEIEPESGEGINEEGLTEEEKAKKSDKKPPKK